MRIDKFVNAVNLTKRRTIAQDMLAYDAIFLNGQPVKPSKDVKVGDMIEIRLLNGSQHYKVLAIPSTKTTPKSEQERYIQLVIE